MIDVHVLRRAGNGKSCSSLSANLHHLLISVYRVFELDNWSDSSLLSPTFLGGTHGIMEVCYRSNPMTDILHDAVLYFFHSVPFKSALNRFTPSSSN